MIAGVVFAFYWIVSNIKALLIGVAFSAIAFLAGYVQGGRHSYQFFNVKNLEASVSVLKKNAKKWEISHSNLEKSRDQLQKEWLERSAKKDQLVVELMERRDKLERLNSLAVRNIDVLKGLLNEDRFKEDRKDGDDIVFHCHDKWLRRIRRSANGKSADATCQDKTPSN